MLDLYGKILRQVIKEYGFEDITPDQWKKAYIGKINKTRDNLITKGEKNKDFHFILGPDVKNGYCGKPNKCETNTFNYVKEHMEAGDDNFFPVGGFGFEGQSLFPVEHWWVYDKTKDQFLEVTPLQEPRFRCYAGIINFDINGDIKEATKFNQVDFFLGGHVEHTYFK